MVTKIPPDKIQWLIPEDEIGCFKPLPTDQKEKEKYLHSLKARYQDIMINHPVVINTEQENKQNG